MEGTMSRKKDVISWHPNCVKSMKHFNNQLNLLNNMKKIQQKEREAWIDPNGQNWNVLHLGNLNPFTPVGFPIDE